MSTAKENRDEKIFELLEKNDKFFSETICLVGSGNVCSQQIRDVLSAGLTNTVVEGYIGKRYHAGCKIFDEIEGLAIERCKELFKATDVNVQPHSGSQANQAAILGVLKKGGKILSLSIKSGGHISHNVTSFLSEIYEIHNYEVDPVTFELDYDNIESIAIDIKPDLIICGASSYTRKISFSRFREIADKVGALMLADIAHISGLVAAGLHESPIDLADITTASTYKTIRGPRGGLILFGKRTKADMIKKINNTLIPRLQSALHPNFIAAKAVCFFEALNPDFIEYQNKILANSKKISEILLKNNIDILTGGTENHLVVISLKNRDINGKELEEYLESINILSNKNLIPFDTLSPDEPSGLRLGTSTFTTTGFDENNAGDVAEIISLVINNPERNDLIFKNEMLTRVKHIINEKNEKYGQPR